MRALVTGASGFIGSAVARRLVESGFEVRALVRPAHARRNLEGVPCEIAEGDLTDENSLIAAVKGCEALFHVAADYRLWVPNPSSIYRTNVDGTRNLMLAAIRADVSRVVYTSSVATLGLTPNGSPADEETPSRLSDMIGHYKRSKYLAETEVTRLARDAGLPVVIVNPSAPIGPRDVRPTPTGRMIVQAARGKMPAYVETGLNVVHVDDVAEGHLLAHAHGVVGDRYILGGENLSLRKILETVAGIVGRKPPKVRLPHNLVLPIAYIVEGFARLARSTNEPAVTVDGVRLAKKFMYFKCDKAIRVLGYRARPASAALEDAITWFRENGYLG